LGFPEKHGDCHIKYGYIAGDSVFVVKIAAGFYDNPSKGLPSSNGVIIAVSAETGQVIATLNDEGWLTDLRTGIGGAVATFALCRDDAENFSIVGTGTQARFQARAIAALAPRPIRIGVWGRSSSKARALQADLDSLGLKVEVEDDLEAMCRGSDVVVTTTPSSQPLILSD
jgi:ornithine cyclodeaminase